MAFEAVTDFPDRFVTIVRVDVRATNSIDALRDVIARGARHVRFTLIQETDLKWLGGRPMVEIAAAMADHGSVAEFHCEPGN